MDNIWELRAEFFGIEQENKLLEIRREFSNFSVIRTIVADLLRMIYEDHLYGSAQPVVFPHTDLYKAAIIYTVKRCNFMQQLVVKTGIMQIKIRKNYADTTVTVAEDMLPFSVFTTNGREITGYHTKEFAYDLNKKILESPDSIKFNDPKFTTHYMENGILYALTTKIVQVFIVYPNYLV